MTGRRADGQTGGWADGQTGRRAGGDGGGGDGQAVTAVVVTGAARYLVRGDTWRACLSGVHLAPQLVARVWVWVVVGKISKFRGGSKVAPAE